MASLFKRLRNVLDDHQDDEKQTAVTQTAERFRDDLLGQALQLKHAWTNDLVVDQGEHHNAFISANYRGRLEEINLSLGSVQQIAPSVAARVDVDDFQKSAGEEARESLAGSVERLEELDYFEPEQDGLDRENSAPSEELFAERVASFQLQQETEKLWVAHGPVDSPFDRAIALEHVKRMGGELLIVGNRYLSATDSGKAANTLFNRLQELDATKPWTARDVGYSFHRYVNALGYCEDPAAFSLIPKEIVRGSHQVHDAFVDGVRASRSTFYSEDVERFPGGSEAREHVAAVDRLTDSLRNYLSPEHQQDLPGLPRRGRLFTAEPRSGNYAGEVIAVADGKVLQQVSPGVAVAHRTELLDRPVAPGEWARINYSNSRGSVKPLELPTVERERGR